ncbi:hypothetical protein [Methylomonas sp. TEB]|uniref:hypothetical protein n=1 Tax=Methylomonas sp. TEB TaxID=3398229 RepID=UPI0039F61AA1
MRKKLLLLLPLIITLGLFAVYWMLLTANTEADWVKQPWAFGDSFGLLNTLFTGLAFSGLIIQIWMQREDLTQSRKQFERSANAQERSARLSAFSDLLREYNEQIRILEIKISDDLERRGNGYTAEKRMRDTLNNVPPYKHPKSDALAKLKEGKQNILNELEKFLQADQIS